MILLVLLASILIAAVTVYQYNDEAKDYHKDRLERKEENIRAQINYVLRETTYELTTEKIPLIFKDKIYEIAAIHKLQINLYDLEGGLLKTSKASFRNDSIPSCLKADVLNVIANSATHHFVTSNLENGKMYQSSYSYLTDNRHKPLAILNLPYLEDDTFINKELKEFLVRLAFAYVFMLLIAISLAYWLSKYITQSLQAISEKMMATRFERRNEKIQLDNVSEEIASVIDSYNAMIDELEDSAVKLARSEREQAWREMAKQVAHEIKNPLTPMRLSVQSFQRKFDANDPDIQDKVDDFSQTLIQQIDTMGSIASAFSNFAQMPAQKKETLNVTQVVKLALDIFSEDYIVFIPEQEEIIAKFDRTQLIRVVTNLVKNAIQSIPEDINPKIVVTVNHDNSKVKIVISDNGMGIDMENRDKIFEPKFTTKTSGMGLGLAMVKNIVETYHGSITFTSEKGKGTVFTVKIPKA
ncbi:sensor histidine kinase [Mangrovimonas aestuarii]|uniref:sensor histidine kinase n=1 Tax=Mangrovimonas aestuarii TaxID=3018443 RepID=UPI0023798D7A|nr:ATP-binding protein [Mangrovimonas aestuarii]